MDFEYACKYLLEELGSYTNIIVTPKGPKGGDGGIDLEMYQKDGDSVVLGQCKLWKTPYQGLVKTIRELAGCMARDKVARGVLLITVEANEYEKQEAEKCGIEIIDAPKLDEMIAAFHRAHGDTVTIHKKSVLMTCLKWIIGITICAIIFWFWGRIILGVFLIIVLLAAPRTHQNYSYSRSRSFPKRHYSKYHSHRRNNHFKNYRGRKGGWGH